MITIKTSCKTHGDSSERIVSVFLALTELVCQWLVYGASMPEERPDNRILKLNLAAAGHDFDIHFSTGTDEELKLLLRAMYIFGLKTVTDLLSAAYPDPEIIALETILQVCKVKTEETIAALTLPPETFRSFLEARLADPAAPIPHASTPFNPSVPS